MKTVTNITYAFEALGITEALKRLAVFISILLFLLLLASGFVFVIWAVKTVWFWV